MTRLTRTLITSAAFVGAFYVAGDFWLQIAREHEAEETKRVVYYTLAKQFEAEKAEHDKLTAYIELESKRTTVQHEIRKVVIAEYKKCRKGKCM